MVKVASVPEAGAVVSVRGAVEALWSAEPMRLGPLSQELQSAVGEEQRHFLEPPPLAEAEQPLPAEANSSHRADRGMDKGSSTVDSKPVQFQPQ